ncbi:MAG: class I SAM-dependent RNA methyltransferase [Pseudomonadota bacterium]
MKLPRFELFAACAPGLEPQLTEELKHHGWAPVEPLAGGVSFRGTWPDIWRANLLLRTANRVLVRIGTFRAPSLPVLYGEALTLPWQEFLRPGAFFAVKAECRKSKIYHSGAAAERLTKAIVKACGALVAEPRDVGDDPEESGGPITVFLRIIGNEATVSVDSSGALLHRRGFKENVAGAPLRETLAAAFLTMAQFDPAKPLVDPFCGSGTIVLEAADIASGKPPGRARRFAFEDFASFHREAYQRLHAKALTGAESKPSNGPQIFGFDRAEGAINAAEQNIERAGAAGWVACKKGTVSELVPPTETPGLLLTNPPYGKRLGDGGAKDLRSLYRSLGEVVRTRFTGWDIGLVTANDDLAKATGLRLKPSAPIPHGGLKVRLWQTQA